jgi:hypothetical protein
MAVAGYQMRISVYHLCVVIAAVLAASERPLKWIAAGYPATREYLSVEIDGQRQLVDARVWPDHPLNPKNRAAPSGIGFPPKL